MTDRINVRGLELAFERRGGGSQSFVWGHGLTSSRAAEEDGLLVEWEQVVSEVALLRYDARGHGESSTPVGAEKYRWSEMAEDQLALTSALGIDRYVAGGASLGAATALHAAVMAPDRIAALVLVIPPTAWETRAGQTELYLQMADVVEASGVEPLIKGAAMMPPPDPFVDHPEFRERSTTRLRGFGGTRLATVFRGAATADFPSRDEVAHLSVPAMILAWSGDPGHPVSTAEELESLLPHAESHVSATWDDYRTWTSRIVDFLHRAGH